MLSSGITSLSGVRTVYFAIFPAYAAANESTGRQGRKVGFFVLHTKCFLEAKTSCRNIIHLPLMGLSALRALVTDILDKTMGVVLQQRHLSLDNPGTLDKLQLVKVICNTSGHETLVIYLGFRHHAQTRIPVFCDLQELEIEYLCCLSPGQAGPQKLSAIRLHYSDHILFAQTNYPWRKYSGEIMLLCAQRTPLALTER